MKQCDHRALARFLMREVGDREVWRGRRRALFFLGNLLPDYLPLTYLRGVRQSRGLRGHDRPYSEAYIRKSIRLLEGRAHLRVLDFYRLGSLLHYLADSFTFVHTEAFDGDLRAHRRYEWALHRVMTAALEAGDVGQVSVESCRVLWERARAHHARALPRPERDGSAILSVCRAVTERLVLREENFGNFQKPLDRSQKIRYTVTNQTDEEE